MRSTGLEKNASAFFDPVNLLRRILANSSHPRGSDEPLGPRRCVAPVAIVLYYLLKKCGKFPDG